MKTHPLEMSAPTNLSGYIGEALLKISVPVILKGFIGEGSSFVVSSYCLKGRSLFQEIYFKRFFQE